MLQMITATLILISVLSTEALASPPGIPSEITRTMSYCTDAGTTYYCLFNTQGNTINGKSCSYGIENQNNGKAIEGENVRNLPLCLQYCSDWLCYNIKYQQESDRKPVVGSHCCYSSSWTTTR